MSEATFLDEVLTAGTVDASAETTHSVKLVLLDSIAVVLGTLDHDVAATSRRVFAEPSDDAVIWGMGKRGSLRSAITANGAALRCYDFNDLYIGDSGQGGHPSDAIPALVAVAEKRRCSGAELIRAVTIAYDDIVRLMDVANVTTAGWDYANLVGLGAVRGLATLLGLDEDERRRAAGIFGCAHLATNELESGALGGGGNLTSWKRFNGSQALLGALDSCLLAKGGVEAPYDSLTGRHGFFRLQGVDPEAVLKAVAERPPRIGVRAGVMKQWPVGSRAQSAIQAAVAIHAQLPAGSAVTGVTITTHPEVIGHLVRPESFRPRSRETADHSLPYITCVALLRGDVEFADFDDPLAWQREDVVALLGRTRVEPLEDSRRGAVAGHPTRVAVTLADGRVLTEQRELPPDKLSAAAMEQAIEQKWAKFAAPRLGAERAARARALVLGLGEVADIGELTAALIGRGYDAKGRLMP